MLNPRPPLLPAADPKSPSTSDSVYETDQPFEQVAPHILGARRHSWFEIYDIGVPTQQGSNSISYASPLTAGTIMRILADQAPDFWLVSLVVNAANAEIKIWRGADPAGMPIRLRNGGFVKLPAIGLPNLCIQNSSAVSVVGTVLALAGWRETDILLNCANQA